MRFAVVTEIRDFSLYKLYHYVFKHFIVNKSKIIILNVLQYICNVLHLVLLFSI